MMMSSQPPVERTRTAPTRIDFANQHECPACGATGGEPVKTVDPVRQHRLLFPFDHEVQRQLNGAYGGPDEYRLSRCPRCRLTYAIPMAAPDDAWYALLYEALEVKPEPRWEYDVVLGETRPSAVYEIGCGSGMFLRICRARQIHACGIDFSDYALEACTRQGLTALKSDLHLRSLTVPGSLGRPDLVASFHVLEHLARPGDLFRHAFEVSREDATLWVSVPSQRRPGRLLDFDEPLDDPPHHMTKWTEEAFRECGSRHGWALQDVWLEPFSWRAALYTLTSRFGVYERLYRAGWLRRWLPEVGLRLILAPAAAAAVLARIDRRAASGFSMLARFAKRS